MTVRLKSYPTPMQEGILLNISSLDASSCPESSVWTWFGSVPIDPDYKAQHDPRSYSPDSYFSRKNIGPIGCSQTYSPRPSPRASPTSTDGRSLGRDVSSVHSLDTDLPYLKVPVASALRASSPSSKLLALAGTDYAVVNSFYDRGGGLGKGGFRVSRTTASSGEVQSVDAM